MYCTHVGGSDYVENSLSGVIVAGSTQAQVSFTIINDAIEEVDEEEFGLQLQLVNSPGGVVLGQSQGSVTIRDDDSECVHLTQV